RRPASLRVLCEAQAKTQAVLDYLREWTRGAGLTLHPTKTRIVEATSERFDSLGWHGYFRDGHPTGLTRESHQWGGRGIPGGPWVRSPGPDAALDSPCGGAGEFA
ncbi:MAG TPA: hypothetical protein P5525_20345, partial [Candidatus Paceibacterota bacterium]|nr:hypothetical protein [Candidatus Paceibacterota bacterium]